MNKDKEWLKEEINKVTSRVYGADFNTIKETDDLINQLDEPKITEEQALNKLAVSYSFSAEGINTILQAQLARYSPVSTVKFVQPSEPELPAIPQFVADWIEKNKNKYNIKTALGNIDAQEDDICDWVLYNLDTFSIAFITGNYTVELEPYWVVSFQAGDFYSTLDEIAYFKEFIRDDSIRIKPNGRTFKNDPEVYGFKDKAKAEAVALLINGAVEEVME